MPDTTTDIIGRQLTEQELAVLDAYNALKSLAGRDDLAPCAERNVKKALACMWQATNDLGLQFEQLYDVGV
jgi:hypothetical protein